MRIVRDWNSNLTPGGSVATIGMFDGVHRGHRVIIETVLREARARGLPAVVITFDNHPRSVLPGRQAPKMLTPPEYRMEVFRRLGVDIVMALHFDMALSATTRREFVERVLAGALSARCVIMGFNSKFGKDGRGDAEYLKEIADEFHFSVTTVEPLLMEGQVVSSTQIRHWIEDGRLDLAATMLGRPVSVYGPVTRGDGRGRSLGFPTANIDAGSQLTPPTGVYVGRLSWQNTQPLSAVINIGIRPTYHSDDTVTVEAHALDFSGDLYGKTVELEIHRRLREEMKFPGPDALKEQIQRDISQARSLVNAAESPVKTPR